MIKSQLPPNGPRSKRDRSELRDLHNSVKRKLILDNLQGCKTIMDMGFGRGGDLPKYKQLNVSSIVGIDPDESSLRDSVDRAATLGMSNILTTRTGSTDQIYHPTERYDAVVCNFALQYFFERELFLTSFLTTIRTILKPGGKFIGIAPDAIKVIRATSNGEGYYKDKEGNAIMRNPAKTGCGNYNEKVSFSVQGPFYDGKPKIEPMCYMDNLYTQAMNVGFVPVDAGPVSEDCDMLSHIYTWFVFTV